MAKLHLPTCENEQQALNYIDMATVNALHHKNCGNTDTHKYWEKVRVGLEEVLNKLVAKK